MQWANKLPTESAETASWSLSDVRRICGPRSSGKTQRLIQISLDKSPKSKTLALGWWASERQRWERETKNLKNFSFQTPDGLAFALVNKWAQKQKKKLLWTVEQPVRELYNEQEYCKKLLAQNRMTAGGAHWLLKEQLEDFLDRSIIPTALDLLLLDDTDEWEPEALSWCRRLTAQRKVESSKKGDPRDFLLEGTFCPRWTSRLARMSRTAKFEKSPRGPGGWTIEILEKIGPESLPLAIIIQDNKDQWKQYFKQRSSIPMDILCAAECEGRKWNTILIPKLEKDWGPARTARSWLDLACSRAESQCIIRLPDSLPSWLPKIPEDLKDQTPLWLSWIP